MFQTVYAASDLSLVGALAAIRVSPATGLVTSKAGAPTEFTVVLATKPSATVTLNLSSSNTSEGTVSPSSLTFTTSDWDVPQTVVVTGVNDNQPGSVPYPGRLRPGRRAPTRITAGLTAAPVSLTNLPGEVETLQVGNLAVSPPPG